MLVSYIYHLDERPTMNLIEQLEKFCSKAIIPPKAKRELLLLIEQHKSEAVEPVAYTDSDNNYLEWTIEALCEKAVCSKNDAIPLYTSPQPDHTKLIGELVEALESFDIFDDIVDLYRLKKNIDLDALLTKAREAIK